MGYYTYYNLKKLPGPDSDFESLCKDLNDIIGAEVDLVAGESLKWYDWETDMLELSKKYPELTLELSGDGEDSWDLWEARFEDGQEEYHEAEMPPFRDIL